MRAPIMVVDAPTLDEFRAAALAVRDAIRRTPTFAWHGGALADRRSSALWLKLELLQVTGSFKARAALLAARNLAPAERARGLTGVSAGNHAIAVAWAARAVGTTAKLVMPRTADPWRVARCREQGGEVVLVDDVHQAFATAQAIAADEGRTMLHPFEGKTVATGTGTVALEILDDVPELEAIVVPIGGGGLCAGIAAAVKQLRPEVAVYGVEPTGADSMHRSFAAGAPQGIDAVRTIADSLGAPHAAPYSYGLCRAYVDELVHVDDAGMRDAMRLLYAELKLAAEPAGAAATAAVLGPLASRLDRRRVVALVCGSNIGPQRLADLLRREDEATPQ